MLEVRVDSNKKGNSHMRAEGHALDLLAESHMVVSQMYAMFKQKDEDLAAVFKHAVQDDDSPVWRIGDLLAQDDDDDDDDDEQDSDSEKDFGETLLDALNTLNHILDAVCSDDAEDKSETEPEKPVKKPRARSSKAKK